MPTPPCFGIDSGAEKIRISRGYAPGSLSARRLQKRTPDIAVYQNK